MNRVLLLDVETTGLTPGVDRITELGMMVTSLDFKEVFASYNKLLYDTDYPEIPKEVEEITGISTDMLQGQGIKPWLALEDYNALRMVHNIKYVIAYNAPFDKSFIDAELSKSNTVNAARWLCAMTDTPAHKKCKSWKLMHVALDHGVAVDPSELHRAINDVELMRKMLVAAGETADSMYMYSTMPHIYIAADVRKPWEDGGDSSTKAKTHGFTFEKVRGEEKIFSKTWVKKIKENEYRREDYPFMTKIIGG